MSLFLVVGLCVLFVVAGFVVGFLVERNNYQASQAELARLKAVQASISAATAWKSPTKPS